MTKPAVGRSFSLFGACGFLITGIALVALEMAGCGGSGGGSRTGTGGGGGSGGVITGNGGSGGSTGTGGAGGTTTTALSCSPGVNPSSALLADFSANTWRASAGKWGVVGNLTGSIFAYHGSSAGTAWNSATVDTTAEDLVASGTVDGGDYAGVGMAFDQCVNTTTWKGISFTLGGTTGGCSVQLQVQTFEQQATSNKGGCVADPDAGVSCYSFPKLTLPSSAGTQTVLWSDLSGGIPTDPNAIAAEILGFQWQMVTNAPGDGGAQQPCTVNMTIDDVSFVTMAPAVDAATDTAVDAATSE